MTATKTPSRKAAKAPRAESQEPEQIVDVIEIPAELFGPLGKTYSADTIASKGQIRKPLEFDGRRWVSVGGIMKGGGYKEIWFVEVVSLADFEGSGNYDQRPTQLHRKDEAVDHTRPLGSYDGRVVRCGKEDCVLLGPQRTAEKARSGTPVSGVGAFSPETGEPRTENRKLKTEHSDLVALPLDKLQNHPGNPDSTADEIVEMMTWLSDGQQDEPITVRPLADPIGHYEVLAGKRRLAAALQLGLDTLDARIRRDLADDRDATAFAARNNLERRTENDLRKAHWLRYQVDQLGLTVADAAAAMGIAQSTASNIMAVGELCESFPYWREQIISGAMTSAHLRPVKKFRDCPEVMKLLVDNHRELTKDAETQEWRRSDLIECWGTRDAIERSVEQLIEQSSRALTMADMIDGEGSWNDPKFDAEQLTTDQRKKLKIASLPAPGDKSELLISRCFDPKAWGKLQDEARASAAKKTADLASKKSGSPGSGEKGATGSASATRERTPAEQKRLDLQRGKQLADRIRGWRHAWLKSLVAARLDQHPLIVARLRAWLQTEPFSGIVAGELNLAGITIREAAGGKVPVYRDSAATWNACAKLSIADVDRISLALVRAILEHEDRDSRHPRLDFEMVDSLAVMAGIDVAAEWATMQQSSTRPVEFETFFLLHDLGQLEKLSGELKVAAFAPDTKKQRVARLTGQPRRLPLPKSIATLVTKKSKKR